ncbi:Protein scd2/ral3 [Vanrija pseudolonga]|uniref:Protein scd2/ral3 n=1 Tax=Vanrija pseudolonga TaxID=143232 RepID=A0AAF1BNR6_9TREE|nr:Protein scd2/ral3 [Vanrija pseudolonga]
MKSLRRSLNNGHHHHGHGHGTAGPSAQHAPQGSQGGWSGYPNNNHIAADDPVGGSGAFINPIARPTEKVAPPQKVIKALNSHRSTNPQELSYQKGDFWYVTGEREGWYEALNPITGSRGLVPKSDFEEFAKGGRQNAPGAGGSQSGEGGGGGSTSPTSPVATLSDHARSLSRSAGGQQQQQQSQAPFAQNAGPGSPTMGLNSPTKKKTQPLYAIVQYDFHAERPDELEAKAGEPIVVIAQSNHEWFVAKPIGRLGGPGLIPVAFVEIRDPISGKPIEVFPSTIPQVEEWKKATAEYKAAAIPLGRLDLAPDQHVTNSPYAAAAQAAALAQGDSQTSEASHQSNARSGSPSSATRRQPSPPISNHTARTGYRPEQDQMLPAGELVQLGVPSFHNESGNYWFRLHCTFVPDDQTQTAYTLILYRTYEDFYDFQITLLDTFPTEAGRQLPGEEDRTPPPRILPYMPGPVDEPIDDELTEYRRDELDSYVRALLDLRGHGAGYILRHELIRTFFAAKYGDYCEESPRADAVEELQERLGDLSFESGPPSSSTSAAAIHHLPFGARQGSDLNVANQHDPTAPLQPWTQGVRNNSPLQDEYLPGLGNAPGTGSNHARNASTTTASTNATVLANQQQSSSNHQNGGWASTSGSHTAGSNSFGAATAHIPPQPIAAPVVAPPPPQLPASVVAAPAPAAAPRPPGKPSTSFVKIKIYDRKTDDLIALRVHPTVGFADLLDKVRARLGPEINVLQYRIGGSGPASQAQNAPQRPIRDDRELSEWINTEDQKMVLYAEQ